MASKTSAPEAEPWPGPRVDFADFAARVAKRRAELGEPDLPRNSGARRTPSKRALLKAMKDTGGIGNYGTFTVVTVMPVTVTHRHMRKSAHFL